VTTQNVAKTLSYILSGHSSIKSCDRNDQKHNATKDIFAKAFGDFVVEWLKTSVALFLLCFIYILFGFFIFFTEQLLSACFKNNEFREKARVVEDLSTRPQRHSPVFHLIGIYTSQIFIGLHF
jgi:hypothetical protein